MAFVKMQPYIWIPSAPKIYGAEWLGTSDPAWTRTNDSAGLSDPNPAVNNGNGNSPFDTIYPWKDMRRVEDSAAGTLVEIPKFYYKWVRNGAKMKLLITDRATDGFYVSPAHADRGDGKGERDVVYVGAYHCASDYKSKTGVTPLGNKTRAEFRTGIHNLGSTIWQNDFAMFWTIGMLYLVEYAHWQSRIKIGYGCSNSSRIQNSGLCDAMTYHTGTNVANRTTYGHTRYRYIEDLWGNVFDFCDGIYFSGANVYGIKNPVNFSDSTGGTLVGTRATTNNWIAEWTNPTALGFEYMLYPSAVSSDYVGGFTINNLSDGVVSYIGSDFYQAVYRSLFCFCGDISASSKTSGIGSRLMKLP